MLPLRCFRSTSPPALPGRLGTIGWRLLGLGRLACDCSAWTWFCRCLSRLEGLAISSLPSFLDLGEHLWVGEDGLQERTWRDPEDGRAVLERLELLQAPSQLLGNLGRSTAELAPLQLAAPDCGSAPSTCSMISSKRGAITWASSAREWRATSPSSPSCGKSTSRCSSPAPVRTDP